MVSYSDQPPLVLADSCGLVVHALRSLRLLLFKIPSVVQKLLRSFCIGGPGTILHFFCTKLHHFLHLADRKCLICNGPVVGIAPSAFAARRPTPLPTHMVERVAGLKGPTSSVV